MWEFRDLLTREFAARQAKNPRYSLRAFATFLGTDHSTLSQILRGVRRIPANQLRHWGRMLGMSHEEVSVHLAEQHVPSGQIRDRQEQLRHWTAEALAIISDPCHWQIVELTRTPGFRGDSRLVAERVGAFVDRVDVALARLLRLRLLEIRPGRRWQDLLASARLTESGFKKLALVRIRELAVKEGVKLLPIKTRSMSNS